MNLNKLSTLSSPVLLVLSLGFLSVQFCIYSDASVLSNASRILGGTAAKKNPFPFQVYLEIPEPLVPNTVSICSGTIIKHHVDNRYKILTAANCFDSILEHNKTTDKNLLITVIMGVNYNVTLRHNGKVLQLKYATVKIHEKYNIPRNSHANDIAIIPLPAGFKPVHGLYNATELAPSTDENKNYTGTEVKVGGWGQVNEDIQNSDQHLFIQTKILGDDACEQARVSSGTPALYNKNFLCTNGTGGKGICRGDFGAPLLAGKPPVVVGIASYRLTSECGGSTPSYFIRVVKYHQWITITI